MKMHVTAVVALMFAASAPGQVFWNEGVDGDLSGDRLAPNAFVLNPGANTLLGVLEGVSNEGELDRDFFSITIPAGFELTQINLTSYVSDDFAAFIGIVPGSIFNLDPDDIAPSDLFGWTLFGPFDVGVDLLAELGANGMGFTPPLPSGTYSFWVQQTGSFTAWSADFVVVPAPGAALAVVMGGIFGSGRRRRRG